MSVPILVVNGLSTLFANDFQNFIKPWFPFPMLLFCIKQALPITVTLYIGFNVLLKWGRKAEQYHNAANDFKILQNLCYFKLQSLDLSFLLKTKSDRIKFLKEAQLAHDDFFSDAAKKEERAAKASSPIPDRVMKEYHHHRQREMRQLLENHKNMEHLKQMDAKIDEYQRMTKSGEICLTKQAQDEHKKLVKERNRLKVREEFVINEEYLNLEDELANIGKAVATH